MFKPNKQNPQEKLTSIAKELPKEIRRKLQDNWSTTFHDEVFSKIDEEKFAPLYSDIDSRPNKAVNELVSLEIMRRMKDWTDEEMVDQYLFNLQVNNALGKEDIGQDNLTEKTIYNFRRRLLEYKEETGINLMQETFKDLRDTTMEKFSIRGEEQRMDTKQIDANIKNLTRLNLFVRVLHNFLRDLPDNELDEIPEKIKKFAKGDNLDLSHRLRSDEAKEKMGDLAEYLAWIADRYQDHEEFSRLKSFEHVLRALDDQCYRIREIEEPEDEDKEESEEDKTPVWEPVRKRKNAEEEEDTATDDVPKEKEGEDSSENDDDQKRVGLKDPEDISSDSLQNPFDDEATYRKKNGEWHQGFKSNWCETCVDDNPFQLITWVDVETNNTEDSEMLEHCVEDLADETGLENLLNDGAFSGKNLEKECEKNGVTQHFTGIKGPSIDDEENLLARTIFEDHQMIRCPAGCKPYEQEYTQENQRYWGRMKKEICDMCVLKDRCFVNEKINFYSYGFYHRDLVLAKRRAKIEDPEYKKFLNKRAGAESMINEAYHKTGDRARYSGQAKIDIATSARAIGINAKRVHRYKKNAKIGIPSK